jgi:hypothetical protein
MRGEQIISCHTFETIWGTGMKQSRGYVLRPPRCRQCRPRRVVALVHRRPTIGE